MAVESLLQDRFTTSSDMYVVQMVDHKNNVPTNQAKISVNHIEIIWKALLIYNKIKRVRKLNVISMVGNMERSLKQPN